MLKTKSIYEKPEKDDGQRIFVSSYWPKDVPAPRIDIWYPELGSPLELIRNWPGNKFDWAYFVQDYRKRLTAPRPRRIMRTIAAEAQEQTITLICQARDERRSHRRLLKQVIEEQLEQGGSRQD